MSTLHVNLIGRFGNQMFQYAYARAYAERNGMELSTPPWVGQEIFDIHDTYVSFADEVLPPHYHQDQVSLIYTRKQVKEWFRFKPELELDLFCSIGQTLAHRRTGDYEKLGYVVVSEQSYFDAANQFHAHIDEFLTEEKAVENNQSFIVDFYRMVTCSVLFRANSTFSWWAATLGNAKVYSPVIEGLEGGKEQDCKFVEGNWPRFANLPFITDLHLEEG